MRAPQLRRLSLGRLLTEVPPTPVEWLWHGYLRPGEVVLLTSRWKTGKTTLLTGLLRHLGTGQPFLDRPVRPGRAWVISEENDDLWRDRVRTRPVGDHVELFPRPFRGRPTPAEWSELIDTAADARTAGELDLFVVDPLASFLPGHCESNAAALLDALHPLHRLTTAGACVLLLHHPRKKQAEAGESARGSGALSGFADVLMELSRYGRLKTDAHRRLIFARSRRPETPERVAYEWDAAVGEFRTLLDPRERQFAENWATVEKVLTARGEHMTCREIRANWPDDAESPCEKSLYLWLHAAHAKETVKRTGAGTKGDPYRFRLRTKADDEHDRYLASLPPLEDLPPRDDLWG
jgi:hypothetical protein